MAHLKKAYEHALGVDAKNIVVVHDLLEAFFTEDKPKLIYDEGLLSASDFDIGYELNNSTLSSLRLDFSEASRSVSLSEPG